MPLTLRYKVDDTTTVTGKGDALNSDAKTQKVIALLCEAELGVAVAAQLDATAQATYAAQWAAQQMRVRARRYRNARTIAQVEANDATNDDI